MQNPWKDHPRSINPPQRPVYPAKFKHIFEGPDAPSGGYMWASPKDPALLDYKNATIALIGRSPDLGTPPGQFRTPGQSRTPLSPINVEA